MDLFFPAAHAAEGAPAQGDPMGMFIMLAIFIAVFYFLIIRPQTKRQKEHQKLVAGLEKGDEVVTGSGILGRITEVGDQFVSLEVADGITLKVQKHAVGAVLPKGTFKKA